MKKSLLAAATVLVAVSLSLLDVSVAQAEASNAAEHDLNVSSDASFPSLAGAGSVVTGAGSFPSIACGNECIQVARSETFASVGLSISGRTAGGSGFPWIPFIAEDLWETHNPFHRAASTLTMSDSDVDTDIAALAGVDLTTTWLPNVPLLVIPDAAAVPEPATFTLLGGGLLGLIVLCRRAGDRALS
jgi:hypothetical protein